MLVAGSIRVAPANWRLATPRSTNQATGVRERGTPHRVAGRFSSTGGTLIRLEVIRNTGAGRMRRRCSRATGMIGVWRGETKSDRLSSMMLRGASGMFKVTVVSAEVEPRLRLQLVASQEICAGELIVKFSDQEIQRERTWCTMQIDHNRHVRNDYLNFVDHSCEPNSVLDIDALALVATATYRRSTRSRRSVPARRSSWPPRSIARAAARAA